MEISRASEIIHALPGEANRLAKRIGVSRQLIHMLLSEERKGTGVVGSRALVAIFKRAAELESGKGSGKPRKG